MFRKNRITTILTLVTLLTMFVSVAPLKAGNIGGELTLVQIGQLGGRLSGLAVDGGEAYIGVGPRMVVLDVHDPGRIRQVGQTELLPDFVEDIKLYLHTFVFVGLGESGIRVFEAGPWPVELGSLDVPAYGLAIADGSLWVAGGTDGVAVFNITSNPTNSELVATYAPVGIDARKVEFAGGHAFVADSVAGLRVLRMGTSGMIEEVGSFLSDFGASHVALGDDATVYLATWSWNWGLSPKPTPRRRWRQVENNTSSFMMPRIDILDVSDPTSPTLRGHYDPEATIQAIYAAGGYGFVVDEIGGLTILDQNGRVGSYTGRGLGQPALFVENRRVWFGDTAGLWSLNVVNPEEPTLAGHHAIPVEIWDVAVGLPGGYSVVAAGPAGACLVSGDPLHPAVVGCFDTGGEAIDVEIDGLYALVADWKTGITIMNEDLGALVPIGVIPGQNFGRVDKKGNLLAIAAGSDGLKIVLLNWANLQESVVVGWPANGHFYYDISFCGDYFLEDSDRGDYICAAAGWSGLEIFKLKDLSSLELVGTVGAREWSAEGIGVDLERGLAYVATPVDGVRIVDITDPTQPAEIGHVDMPYNVQDVRLNSHFVLVNPAS